MAIVMDPAGLLLSVATVFITIDRVQETYDTTPSTLTSIRSQIKLLEGSLERLQQWLHYTDPSSKAQIMHSLQDAMETVNASIYRLQDALDSTTRNGSKTTTLHSRTGSDQWMKSGLALNEAHLKKHITDVRECVSLMHFTLSVCQL